VSTAVLLRQKFLLFGLVSGLASPLPAQPPFDQEEVLRIELTGPLGSLIEQKEERSRWPFQLKAGDHRLELEVRARGNSRMRVCDFPPLKFHFNKDHTAGIGFEGLDSLKLVNPCRKGDRYKNDVLEEYAAYRIFGLFSDISLRVRLVHITFRDTDDRVDESFREFYGFFIEPLEWFETRVQGQFSGIPAVALGWLDEKQAALVYIFQYLIANTDWSLIAAENDDECCHNIKLIEIDSRQFPVPYDFDLAGLANTRYAHPDPSLPIKRVRHRLYRGFCMNPDILREALAEITSRKNDVLGIIEDLPLLSEKEKAKQTGYLEKFFVKAEDENKLIQYFEKKCHP